MLLHFRQTLFVHVFSCWNTECVKKSWRVTFDTVYLCVLWSEIHGEYKVWLLWKHFHSIQKLNWNMLEHIWKHKRLMCPGRGGWQRAHKASDMRQRQRSRVLFRTSYLLRKLNTVSFHQFKRYVWIEQLPHKLRRYCVRLWPCHPSDPPHVKWSFQFCPLCLCSQVKSKQPQQNSSCRCGRDRSNRLTPLPRMHCNINADSGVRLQLSFQIWSKWNRLEHLCCQLQLSNCPHRSVQQSYSTNPLSVHWTGYTPPHLDSFLHSTPGTENCRR